MRPQQLTLEFSFTSPDKESILDNDVINFQHWTNQPEVKSSKVLSKKFFEQEEISVNFAQRQRSYHLSYFHNTLYNIYKPFFDYFLKKLYNSDAGKSPKTLHVFGYRDVIWMPGRVTIKKVDGRPTATVSYAIYRHAPNNKGERIKGTPLARLSNHVEFKSNGKTLKGVDLDKSYVAFSHSESHPGIFVATYKDLGIKQSDFAFIMPWTTLYNFSNSVPKYMESTRKHVGDYFTQQLDLNGMGAGLQKAVFTGVNNSVTRRSGNNSVELEILSLCISANSIYEILDYILPEELRKLDKGRAFTKHALAVTQLFLRDGPRDRSKDPKPNGDRYYLNNYTENLSTWLSRVRDLYTALWGLMEHYGTPNVLNFFPPELIVNPPRVYNSRFFGNNTSDAILRIAKGKYFSGFPMPKQWRLLADGIFNCESNTVHDIPNMVLKCESEKDDPLFKIPRSDVKTMKMYHDEVVKIYNTIRFKPTPINRDYTEWITSTKGLKVDDNLELVLPNDTNDIRTWGQIQGHCIGSYADRAAQGSQILMGVRDRKSKDWVGHLQIQYPRLPKKESLDGTAEPVLNQAQPQAYGNQYSILPSQNMRITQFYGLRNSQVPQDKKDPVIKHLREAATAYFFKPKKEANNGS